MNSPLRFAAAVVFLQLLASAGTTQISHPLQLWLMTMLEKLSLHASRQRKELSHEIGQLSALKNLRLNCCTALLRLSAKLGRLTTLQTLNLLRCGALEEVPLRCLPRHLA